MWIHLTALTPSVLPEATIIDWETISKDNLLTKKEKLKLIAKYNLNAPVQFQVICLCFEEKFYRFLVYFYILPYY